MEPPGWIHSEPAILMGKSWETSLGVSLCHWGTPIAGRFFIEIPIMDDGGYPPLWETFTFFHDGFP